MIVKAFES
uniref:Uncharacterized protein n=1 Tax=Rhizophora mucronata TaxID=61149 RepID=A0A2P2PFD2_RHIMU